MTLSLIQDKTFKGKDYSVKHLPKAEYDNSTLDKSDFTTAINFTINPENNKLKHAKFSQINAIRLLEKYNIKIE